MIVDSARRRAPSASASETRMDRELHAVTLSTWCRSRRSRCPPPATFGTVTDPVPLPAHWEADVAVRDGRTADPPHHPDDAERSRRSTGRCRTRRSTSVLRAVPELTERDVERFLRRPRRPGRARRDRRQRVVGVGGTTASTRPTPRSRSSSATTTRAADRAVVLEHLAAAARERGSSASSPRCCRPTGACLLDLPGGGLPPEPQARGRRGLAVVRHQAQRLVGGGASRARAPAEALSVAALVSPVRWSSSWARAATRVARAPILSHPVEGGFTGTSAR